MKDKKEDRTRDARVSGKDGRKESFTVHDLPARERPRERLVRVGAGALSSEEVLAIIISRGTKGMSVLNIARCLISRFKSVAGVAAASLEELQTIKGIGIAKACQIKAALELARRLDESPETEERTDLSSAEAVARLMRPLVAGKLKEHFFVLYLDSRNRLINKEQVSIGTLDGTMAHPREVFAPAIRAAAAGIIVVHNHPSGDPQPSDDDIRLTRRLAEAGKIVGISLLDHVIIGGRKLYSFRSRCLL